MFLLTGSIFRCVAFMIISYLLNERNVIVELAISGALGVPRAMAILAVKTAKNNMMVAYGAATAFEIRFSATKLAAHTVTLTVLYDEDVHLG